MAKAVINLQKESGGIVKISPVDGIGVTEVTVPESGVLVTKEYADGLNSTNVKQSANLSDLSNSASARSNLGLGTAATRDVGTGSGNVMQVGAYGLGGVMVSGSNTDPNPTGFYYNPANAQAHGSGEFFLDVKYAGGNYHGFRLSTDTYSNNIYWQAGLGGGAYGLRPRVMLHHTGNILHTTGSSTTFPMTQKSVTDALNTKVGLSGDQTIAGVKTFSSSPIVPTPTTDTQAVNKGYADLKVTKVASTNSSIVRFQGTTGEVQGSGVYIDDNNVIYIGGLGSTYTSISSSQFNMSQFNSTTNNFQFVNRTNGKGIEFYTTSGGVLQKVMEVPANGNLLLTSGTGALGYGAGAGGTVIQLTSKSTAVTLNKPSGRINTHNSALAAGETAYFQLNNSLLSVGDGVIVTNTSYGAYSIRAGVVIDGVAYIYITNTGGTSQSQPIAIQFQIIKGSNA